MVMKMMMMMTMVMAVITSTQLHRHVETTITADGHSRNIVDFQEDSEIEL